jgi:hypothetical protein
MPWSFSRRPVDLFLVSDQFQAHTYHSLGNSGRRGPLLSLFLLVSVGFLLDLSPEEQQKSSSSFSHGRLRAVAASVCVCVLFPDHTRFAALLGVHRDVSLWELLLVRSEGEGRRALPILATGQSHRRGEALLACSSRCGEDKSGGDGIEFIGGGGGVLRA